MLSLKSRSNQTLRHFDVMFKPMTTPKLLTQPEVPEPELAVGRAELEIHLIERKVIGQELHDRQIGSDAELEDADKLYRTWNEYNTTLLRRSFTTKKPADVYSSGSGTFCFNVELSLDEKVYDFRDDVGDRLRRLDSLIAQLQLFDSRKTPNALPAFVANPARTGVFIVHGRADGLKETVARAIYKLTGNEPIILHEQADKGRTVIEKFEDHASEVGFAVVLLTGDDIGGLIGGDQRTRARQNVVFELGYFFGKLGRSRVAVLYEPGVELPSDVNGLLHIAVDPGGGWQLSLSKELHAASINADLNNLK